METRWTLIDGFWFHIRKLSVSSCSVWLVFTAGGLPVCSGLLVFFYLSHEPSSVFWLLISSVLLSGRLRTVLAWHSVALMARCTSPFTLCQHISDKTGLNLGCQSMNQCPLWGFLGTETTAHHQTSPVPPSLPLHLLWTNITCTNSSLL